jgi:oxygen-independent coproporphyrinogen III oxidase
MVAALMWIKAKRAERRAMPSGAQIKHLDSDHGAPTACLIDGCMTPEIIQKYGKPVPRYTSYPTAPHFRSTIDAAAASSWLASLPRSERVSLYIHIPFCRSLCWFCGCHTQITRREAPIERYVGVLLDEVRLVAERLGPARDVAHIHFGGGSPSLLASDDLKRIADALRGNFTIARDAEFAVEIDPRTIDPKRAAALAEIGVNRASIGVQDFDAAVQRAINRHQPLELTAGVIGMLRERGIAKINLDLMYGLPLQTVGSLAQTIAQALALKPDRISLFGYAHVPWMKKHQKLIDEATLPDAWQRWCQARAAGRDIAAAGYVPIGLDHFALPDDALARARREGTLRRNFQGYTADPAGALIGLGTSAISALPQGYVQNAADANAYSAAIAANRLPAVRGLTLTREDRLRGAIIERLVCNLSADFGAMCRSFGFPEDHCDDAVPRLEGLARDGLAMIDGRSVAVPEEARLLVRAVAACFDAYLQPAAQPRHAAAV